MQQINDSILHDPSSEELRYISHVKYTHEEIERMAAKLSRVIETKLNPIHQLVCLMKGGYHWANLLGKFLSPRERINANISLYDVQIGVPYSDGRLERSDFNGKNILVVDDLIVTGRTMRFVLNVIQQKHPKRVEVAVMVDKISERSIKKMKIRDYTHYRAFPSRLHEFLVGYGMTWPSWPESLRDLNNIYVAKAIPPDFESKVSM